MGDAKANWKQLALTFWQETQKQGDTEKKPQKLHRKTAEAWLLATDRQMQVTLGVGVKHFTLPAPAERLPLSGLCVWSLATRAAMTFRR